MTGEIVITFAARPGSTTDPARHHRRSRFCILVLGVFLAGCATFTGDARGAEQAAAPFTFEQYEVVTGTAERQTVLTGFLLGGAVAELAVVHIDEYGQRRVRIYAFGAGAWTPSLDTTLGPDVSFIDVANIGGRDRLVIYERGRLNWFDPESATERGLVTVTSSFTPPRRDEIPHVDLTRDVNDDDRDDLVVPDVDGFWVFVQMEDGAFADPVKIGPPTNMSGIYGADGYRYDPWSQSRVHEIDYDRDGRVADPGEGAESAERHLFGRRHAVLPADGPVALREGPSRRARGGDPERARGMSENGRYVNRSNTPLHTFHFIVSTSPRLQ